MLRNRFFVHCVPFATLALGAAFLTPDSVCAQQTSEDQAQDVIEEIVKIEAAKERYLVGRPNEIGARIEVIELRETVNLADLDLRKAADVEEFESRIENTARRLCEELDDLHPIPVWDEADRLRCVREAVERANNEAEPILADLR